MALTSTGNNFEMAIAVDVGTFGIAPQEADASNVGPLIEVPVLTALVNFSLWLKNRLFPAQKAKVKTECLSGRRVAR